jgi:EasF-like predicted methyltransferase
LELQDKHVQYYALDVSPSILEKSLFDLQMQFPAASNITIHGLVGTYEDCAYWLKHSKPECQKSVLWLGNSIANFEPQEAENLISTFCGSLESDASPVNMIIAADGCRDEMQMRRAYAMVGGQSRKFVLNGLYHANRVLGADHFKIRDWGFASQWNPNSWMYESFVVAEKDLILTIDGEEIYIKRGERIRAIGSGKWPNAKIDSICRGANVQIFDCWLNNNASYGKLAISIFSTIS